MSRARKVAAAAALAGVTVRQVRRRRDLATRRSAADQVRQAAADEALDGWSPTPGTPLLAVVMAAYNEGGSIAGVLASLPHEVCGLPVQVVVIDDGSADDTAAEARRGGALVGTHRSNLGQGDALRTGFAVATGMAARVVVTMDADGQHDPAELPALVGPVVDGAADYVQGSRFLGAYDDAGGARDLGIRGFTQLIRLLTGAPITDCTNGYRAIDGQSLRRLRLVEDRFSAAEIIVQAAGQGLRVREVGVHIRSREVGTSKKPRGLGYPLGFLGTILRSWMRARVPS